MANWSRNKVDSSNLNKGKEWSLDDQVAIEELNAMINSGLYAQDFAEKLVTNIDTSEVNNIGIPSVSLIDGDGATTDKPYKKFKFSNLKGEKGDPGVGATIVQTDGTSTEDVMSQKAVTNALSMWSQRLYEEPDLNTLANIRNGRAYISRISPITANTPKSNIYGNVISFRGVGGGLTQIVMETHSGKMYYRASATSESFGTWKELVLTQSINLENTGYVAFSNGLKIQWGITNSPADSWTGTITYPISFTSSTSYIPVSFPSSQTVKISYSNLSPNQVTFGRDVSTGEFNIYWIAIGY